MMWVEQPKQTRNGLDLKKSSDHFTTIISLMPWIRPDSSYDEYNSYIAFLQDLNICSPWS